MIGRSTCICVAACLVVSPLVAQEAPESSAIVGIEEVTVTARKREESVQDIPLAVTALSLPVFAYVLEKSTTMLNTELARLLSTLGKA